MLVNIRETIEKVVEVNSIYEAQIKYGDGTINLSSEDLKSVEFTEYKDEVIKN